MMDWGVIATIAAPLIALFVGALLNHLIAARPKVTVYLAHASAFRATPQGHQALDVHTHSVVLTNNGRSAARNVRLGHNHLPDFQVFPDIQHHVVTLPGGTREIIIPTIIPKKQLTISYLYFPPLTFQQVNTYIESDEGPGRVITVLPTPQQPGWLKALSWILLIYGLIAVIYSLYTMLKWVNSGT